ncbi:hypothetical protein [Nocardioides sp. B-3]|uniref:hypothetical protein n=1 Tax=Nocardioides sp. B-3 TaxID=2895565 RepID=UPI00215249DE|nr:hypothetical protein [Nocardioides sp. B-3]UUZ59260.1 hypothetical protein LP418_25890 [Nocardioides sp. B-3]
MREFDGSPTCVELLVPIFAECYEQTGFTRRDIGFWCSGSSDYLAGRSFSFVSAVDAIGALPPVNESHVEMDAALGALRGPAEDPDRRGRHRAGLRVQASPVRARCAVPSRSSSTPTR